MVIKYKHLLSEQSGSDVVVVVVEAFFLATSDSTNVAVTVGVAVGEVVVIVAGDLVNQGMEEMAKLKEFVSAVHEPVVKSQTGWSGGQLNYLCFFVFLFFFLKKERKEIRENNNVIRIV